jgi:translation elongation factor EF-Ts
LLFSPQLLLDAAGLKDVTDTELKGASLPDYIALEIGNVGENMQLRRAIYLNVADSMMLGSYVHSAGVQIYI